MGANQTYKLQTHNEMKEQIKNDTLIDWAGVLLGATLTLVVLGAIATWPLEAPIIGAKLLGTSILVFGGYVICRLEAIMQECRKPKTSVYIDIKALESVVHQEQEEE